MFQNRIQQVEVNAILINREARQRTEITPESVIDLACSIARSGWISPLLVDSDTNYLIAGERRLTAVKVLAAAVNGDYSSFQDPQQAREQLFPICSCKVDSWHNWTRVPVQFGTKLTEQDMAVYEFIENAHRKDLPWADRTKAIYSIHAHGVRSPDWTMTSTAQACGISLTLTQDSLRLWRIVENDPDPELLQLILSSPSLKSAMQNAERFISRREPEEVSLSSNLVGAASKQKAAASLKTTPGPKKGTAPTQPSPEEIDWSEDEEDTPQAPALLSDQLLVNADFHEWAAAYNKQPFNFIHCDFPYGISFNTGDQAKTAANAALGEYDDSEDVYWALLTTLKEHRERLIAPSCHVMFWFSQNLRRETEDFFTEMGGTVQPFLMIWHCSDQDGILPDPQRYGRRTYETAMLITFGDRKIVAPRSLSFAAPRESKSRIHRSQKPIGVLNHFFSMFVDSSSRVLDPTAGSGTSVLAAHHAGASVVTGLEIDSKQYRISANFINQRSDTLAL